MMKIKKYFWVIPFLLFPLLMDGQEVLSNLRDQFIQNNDQLKLAKLEVDYARIEENKAKKDRLPQIEFQAQYFLRYGGRALNIPTGDLLNPVYHNLNYLNGFNFPGEGTDLYPKTYESIQNEEIRFLRLREYDTNITATLPLINSGISQKIQLMQMKKDLAEMQFERLLLQEWGTFKIKYYHYLKGQMTLQILKNAAQNTQAQYEQMTYLLNANRLLNRTVESVSLDLETLHLNIREQKLELTEQKRQLEKSLDLDLPINETAISENSDDYSLEYTLEQLTDLWKKNNIQSQLIQQERKLLQQELKLNKQIYQPSLNLVVSSGLQGENLRFNEAPFYAVGALQFKWNLFNPKRSQENKQKAILAGQSLLRHEALMTEAEQGLIRLYNSIVLAKDKLNLKDKQLDFLTQQITSFESEYNEGKISVYDLYFEKQKVKNAKLDYLSSRFDFLIKLCELEQLVGKPLSDSF